MLIYIRTVILVLAICWLADHALAVTCTDGLGLGLGLIRLEKCVGDAVARVAVELFVFKLSFFLFSILYSREGQTKRRPHFLSSTLASTVSFLSRVPS